MKKNIGILGSTGSIGKSLLSIIDKEKQNYKIIFLSANKNYQLLLTQAIKFKVKHIIITEKKYFELAKKKNKKKDLKIYNNFQIFNKILKKKLDYVMSSIVGIEGLEPTINIIRHTHKIAIANKEAIICAWNLIQKELIKYKTKFLPVDSEHFSIWYALRNNKTYNISKIYLTASGGSLLNISIGKYDLLDKKKILSHPNWSMGKKITIDSSTLMNKVFEIIEAKKIFSIPYSKLSILIHPKSYVHALIQFNDGMIKIIAHDTTMKIPISNTLKDNSILNFKSNQINLLRLNNLDLQPVNIKKFKVVKILKHLPKIDSLFETIVVSANDRLVELYLENKIKYRNIDNYLMNFLNKKECIRYKKICPKKISEIIKLNKYVRSKINFYYQ
ncbi:1-deoxy-D-xylulose-5-phosphate reductoisomerase [Candidatus Pelagibacter sp.]|nr:1-deoxy-D-xylulose-5-phosphate reductoisomerase [Candidatus Pelagibacter sp.]